MGVWPGYFGHRMKILSKKNCSYEILKDIPQRNKLQDLLITGSHAGGHGDFQLSQTCSGQVQHVGTAGGASANGNDILIQFPIPKNLVKILTSKPTGKRLIGRPRCRWKGNVNMDFK